MVVLRDDDPMETNIGGSWRTVTRKEYERLVGEEFGYKFKDHVLVQGTAKKAEKKEQVIPEGYKIVTFSNMGDKLELAIKTIARNPQGLPTPEQLGLDNTVIGPDGITNYGFVVREAHRVLGYVSVADGAMC